MSKDKNNKKSEVKVETIDNLSVANTELQKVKDEILATQNNLEDAIAELATAKDELARIKAEKDAHIQELQSKKNEINEAQKDLNTRTLEITKKEADLDKREANAKQGFTKQLEEAKTSVEAEIKARNAEKERLAKEISELGVKKDQKIQQIDREISDYREKRGKAVDDEIEKKRVASLNESVKIEQEAKAKAITIVSGAQKKAEAIESEANKEADTMRTELEKEKEKAKAARTSFEEEKQRQFEERSRYESAFQEYESRLAYLKDKEEQIEAEIQRRFEAECTDLDNKYQSIREQCNKLVSANKGLNKDNAELKDKIVKINSQTIEQKDCEIIELKGSIEKLKIQLEERENIIAQYGCTPDDIQDLKSKSNKFDLACARGKELRDENDKLKLELSFRNNDKAELELCKRNAIRDKETISTLSEELDKKKIVPRDIRIAPIKEELPAINKNEKRDVIGDDISEKAWLGMILDQAKASGLVFNERLLKAYHTSLKIEEWSPLVVLAGVSGTGKSELPRQYALHGGMNFISVPVKPDWDSPQSLFGYYNSIESKFEPTELLRALYQMQDKVDNSKGDQMCLVLLDEMNLAHVELYFADLLSKFEGKRGTNEGAEYEISLGAGVGNEILSIGDNILWTGTMNEDETTKALSDKVVDRSTLVTFPRPKHLIGRQKAKIADAKYILPKKKWLDWVGQAVDLDEYEEIIERFRGIVEQVNDKMSELGRNLGHRVWQGIQNYISNHPDVIDAVNTTPADVEKTMKSVFAEAVAFKIMPKLRGIETSGEYEEYIDAIEKIINADVEELSADFQKARNLPTRVFQWCSAKFLDDQE